MLEDHIVQKAVAILLESVYESDLYEFSYGVRPGRSPHHAVQKVREKIHRLNIGWILDVDIQQCFDTVDRTVFFDLLHRQVKDGGLDRLLGKWFQVGVLDGETLSYSDKGTPPGGTISPSIANVYLHSVLDEWFVKEVPPRLKGRCFLVRVADDAVLGFEYEEDACRVREVLFKRLEKYGLNAHAENTRLVKCTRTPYGGKKDVSNGTCDFLGCTHYWAKSRKGYWGVKRRTSRTRIRRTISRYAQWCQYNRHMSIHEQCQKLNQKLRGSYQYFGIRGNDDSIDWVYQEVRRLWRSW